MAKFIRRISLRLRGGAGVACSLALAASAVAVTGVTPAMGSVSAALLPAGGQFVSIPVVRALDTRYGTGGVPLSRSSRAGR